METLEYWKESLGQAADECGLKLTDEQLTRLADAAAGSHENYGMAFYSPPASDRIADIERGWKAKLETAEATAARYRSDFVKNICKRHNVDASQVTLEGDGNATICP